MLLAKLDDHVELRLLEMRHAQTFHELVCENLDRLYWMTSTPTIEESENRIRKGLERLIDSSGLNAGIFDHGELCGVAALFHINTLWLRGELGYWIGKKAVGRGLVTKACKAILRHGFDELGLHRMEAKCAATNHKSLAVLERLGFQQEGCLREGDRIGGVWVNMLIYGLLEHEWRGQTD